MSRNQWIVVTMLGLGVALVCGCLGTTALIYLTGSFPTPTAAAVEPLDTPTPRPTSTPTTPRVSALCQAATQDHLAQIQPLLEEWDDAVEVANSTARIALSPLVRDMQGIQHNVEDVTVPDCARHGSALLIEGMGSVIDSFIAFMGDEPDFVVSLYFSTGYEEMTRGVEELGALAEGRIPATSTAVPTRVPPSATRTPAPAAATPTSTATQVPSGRLQVDVQIISRTWLEVTVDGEPAFRGLIEAGTNWSWFAENSIAMHVGNAGGVLVTLNGQDLGPLGGADQVVDIEWTWENLNATPEHVPPSGTGGLLYGPGNLSLCGDRFTAIGGTGLLATRGDWIASLTHLRSANQPQA